MAAVQHAGRFESAQLQYARRIKAFSRRNFRSLPGTDQVDLEQEILEVLWGVCNTYDPNHGATFNTYFWECAKRKFLDLHKAASRKKRVGDYERVFLDDLSFKAAMNDVHDEKDVDRLGEMGDVRLIHESAEDEAMTRMSIREQLAAGRKVR